MLEISYTSDNNLEPFTTHTDILLGSPGALKLKIRPRVNWHLCKKCVQNNGIFKLAIALKNAWISPFLLHILKEYYT